MANLLEKANILITPTAYSDGKIHSAKPIQSLGSEISSDVEFSTPLDWSLTGQSVVEDGKAHILQTDSANTGITSNTTLTNKTYLITGVISDYVEGSLRFSSVGSTNQVDLPQENGFFSIEYTSTRSTLSNWNIQRLVSPVNLKLDNVSVKEVIDSDLNFTRGSSATRVNAQGLVENVDTLGSELVTNGDFATDSGWDKASTWTISNSKATSNGGGNFLQQRGFSWTVGVNYRITFDVVNYTSGTIRIRPSTNNSLSSDEFSNIGSYSHEVKFTSNSADNYLNLIGTSFIGSIDNVSVKEVIDVTNIPRINYKDFQYEDSLGSEAVSNGDFSNGTTDWTIEAFSSIEVGDFKGKTSVAKINIGNTGTTSRIRQPFNYVNGKTYKVDIEVYVENGNFRADCSDSFVSGDFVSTSTLGSWQTLTANITSISTGSNFIWLRAFDSISEFYIANVSVKEVTKVVTPNSGVGSWLIEPQSTNEITQSEVFSGYSGNVVVADDAIISPDGNLNGASVTDNNDGGTSFSSQIVKTRTVDVLSNYTWSVFAKKKGNDYIVLRTSAFTTPYFSNSFFDLNLGTVLVQGAGHTAKIENYGNGWYRCSIAFTTDAVDTSGDLQMRLSENGTSTQLTRDGTNSIYTWGWQFEKQSFATSYIPTAGSVQTRLAETASRSGLGDLINSEEGVLYFEGSNITNGKDSRISLSDGTLNNRVSFAYSPNANYAYFIVKFNGTTVISNLSVNLGIDQTQNMKLAIRYKTGNTSLFLNGTELINSSVAFSPATLSILNLSSSNSSADFYGKCKTIAVLPILTDEELECLTTR